MLSAEDITSHTGIAILHSTVLSQGHNATLLSVALKDGRTCVAKLARQDGHSRYTPSLEIEGWMLRYLAAHSTLPVPELLFGDASLLLMTKLPDTGSLVGHAQENAADLLAALHNVHSTYYGLERDTTIGPLHQPNPPSKDWASFYAEQRVLHMARAALEEGQIDTPLMHNIEHLADKLPDFIGPAAPPSLIHGDLWGGNILCTAGQVSGFIDPALYYADPEIELAFGTLFNTFDARFFARYAEHIPIREGFFEERRALYLLYPLLVHVRIYGASYLHKVEHIVKRYVP